MAIEIATEINTDACNTQKLSCVAQINVFLGYSASRLSIIEMATNISPIDFKNCLMQWNHQQATIVNL